MLFELLSTCIVALLLFLPLYFLKNGVNITITHRYPDSVNTPETPVQLSDEEVKHLPRVDDIAALINETLFGKGDAPNG